MNDKKKKILKYWDNPEVESMYDKHLLNLEINLIKDYIEEGTKILDAGCGEGKAPWNILKSLIQKFMLLTSLSPDWKKLKRY